MCYNYLTLCFLSVSGSFALRSATELPVFASSEMLTRISAGLKAGGSFLSTTDTATVAVEVDTGPEKGTSFVTTTSRVKTGELSKSSSLKIKERASFEELCMQHRLNEKKKHRQPFPHFGCREDSLHFIGACGDAEVSPLIAFDYWVSGVGIRRS